MRRLRVLGLAAALAAAACSPEFPTAKEREEAPYGPGVEVNRKYDGYVLYTHCGITHAEIDGSYWEADPMLGEGGNPPGGWGNPLARGTLTIVSNDRAKFVSDGQVARFKRANGRPPPCA